MQEQEKPSPIRTARPLIVIIPSRDGKIYAQTATCLMTLSQIMGQLIGLEVYSGEGVSQSRTEAVLEVVKQIGARIFRGIFMDDDIILRTESLPLLAEAIKYADERHLNLVAPVRLLKGNYNLCKTMDKDSSYTQQELEALPQFARIKIAGLGFYYGDIIGGYQFRVGFNSIANKFCGEDWNYFLDNKLPLNLLKGLRLGHIKTRVLESEI